MLSLSYIALPFEHFYGPVLFRDLGFEAVMSATQWMVVPGRGTCAVCHCAPAEAERPASARLGRQGRQTLNFTKLQTPAYNRR